MKKNLAALFLFFLAFAAHAQEKTTKENTPIVITKAQVVETACGECQFKMKGHGCDLAIRINGQAYFVDGTDIDDHGDAHAKDGFCNKIRKAEVTGKVVDGRFKVTSYKLLADKTP